MHHVRVREYTYVNTNKRHISIACASLLDGSNVQEVKGYIYIECIAVCCTV